LWHLQKFLQYITIEFTPSTILLCPPSPRSWNSFSKSHFFHLHVCVYHIVFAPYSLSYTLSLYPPHTHTHWYQLPVTTCFTFLFSGETDFSQCVETQKGVHEIKHCLFHWISSEHLLSEAYTSTRHWSTGAP
jgi:hypothetical protein